VDRDGDDSGAGSDAEGDDEEANGRPSWRAPRRRDLEQQQQQEQQPRRSPTLPCAHCHLATPRHDVFYVVCHTLLHTYQLESKEKGFFHQRKAAEWGTSEWQAIAESLAEAKEEQRAAAMSRRLSIGGTVSSGGALSGLFSEPAPTKFGAEAALSSSAGEHAGSANASLPPSSPTSRGHTRRTSSMRDLFNLRGGALAADHEPIEATTSAPSRPASSASVSAAATGTAGSGDSASSGPLAVSSAPPEDVPSFALYLDSSLTTPEAFKSACASPAFLGRDVPLCGKCIAHVWMDPLLVRDRFGQPLNPIKHPLSQERSLGAADGTGSVGPAASFNWLKKKNMSAYDRDQLRKAVAASELATAQGDARPSALLFSSARGGKNFIANNVAQARSGVYHVPASVKKRQRDLSTQEGKDPYLHVNALENYWAHLDPRKEDRDLALTLQRRLQVAGAPSADIYAQDHVMHSVEGLQKGALQLERTYGLKYVEKADGTSAMYVPLRTGQHAPPNYGGNKYTPIVGGMPALTFTPIRIRAQSSRRSRSAARRKSKSPERASTAAAAGSSPAMHQLHNPNNNNNNRSSVDGTFLTGVDIGDDHLSVLSSQRGATTRSSPSTRVTGGGGSGGDDAAGAEADVVLDLAEIVQGETATQREVRLRHERGEWTPRSDQQKQTTPPRKSRNSSTKKKKKPQTPDVQLPQSPPANVLAAAQHGGSRMEQRIAEKAQRQADRAAREALAEALLQQSPNQQRQQQKRARSATLDRPRTFSPVHEPKSTMALVFDPPQPGWISPGHSRGSSPAKWSRERESIISRALREEAEQRGKEVQVARLEYAERARGEALMFARPGLSEEALSAHDRPYSPLGSGPGRFALTPDRREARASWYREVRRSPSVGRLRASSQSLNATAGEEQFTDGGLPLERPVTATSPQRQQQEQRRRLSSSASTPGLFSSPARRDAVSSAAPLGSLRSPSVALAHSAYASASMPRVGALSPAQIRDYQPNKNLSFSPKKWGSRPATASASAGSTRPGSGGMGGTGALSQSPNGTGASSSSPSSRAVRVPPAPAPYDPLRALSLRRRPLSPAAARKMSALESTYAVGAKMMNAEAFSVHQGAQAAFFKDKEKTKKHKQQQQRSPQQLKAPRPQSSPNARRHGQFAASGTVASSPTKAKAVYVLARPKADAAAPSQQEAKEESGAVAAE
jgi:hypothetical protein